MSELRNVPFHTHPPRRLILSFVRSPRELNTPCRDLLLFGCGGCGYGGGIGKIGELRAVAAEPSQRERVAETSQAFQG